MMTLIVELMMMIEQSRFLLHPRFPVMITVEHLKSKNTVIEFHVQICSPESMTMVVLGRECKDFAQRLAISVDDQARTRMKML